MPMYFQKPENALKRAHEFIEVGKPEQALDVLYDVIKSKKHRVWQKIHEPIMLLYLELCVDLKKSHTAKEGLYQYKNICQTVNVKSLDTVVRKYLAMAEEKTEAARAESQQTVDDVDDLDIIQTPESLLLAAVTAEDAQDRSDRAILTPWVKFLWESYRQCLDLLRNNNRVERLYHDVAKLAFEFCKKYARKTEFRKLCDNLRNHLKQITEKTHTQATAVSLSNPETLNYHQETRLSQLNYSIAMELWQEAFKAVEDIHDLIVRSKKTPKPLLLANYYENVSLIFLKSGNRLFHAAACHKLFTLVTEHKRNPTAEEISKMANRVLCATLAVGLPPIRFPIDQLLLESHEADKRRRLAALLNLPVPPTRASLVRDLAKNSVLQHVSPDLQTLYTALEGEFDPLNMANRLSGCLEFIGNQTDLAKYTDSLQEMTVVRLVKQVAQIYQTIQFSRLQKLIPFVSAFDLEKVVVQAAKNIDLPVRIDHLNQTISFGLDLNTAGGARTQDGPFLQHMPGDQLKNQLQLMAKALSAAMDKLNIAGQDMASNMDMKLKIIDAYRKNEKRDRDRILRRKDVIEHRKEELEQTSREKDELELEKERERQKVLRKAEEERLRREAEQREKQRIDQERESIRRKEAEKRIEQLKTTEIGIRTLEGLTEEELRELDTDDIVQKQVEQLEKEKRELQERLKSQEKKVDYFIRAKRIEEVPLLEEDWKERALKNREAWNKQEQDRIEAMKTDRELAMKHRDRLRRMAGDKEAFISQLKEARQDQYQAQLEKFKQVLVEERKVRLAERKEARQLMRKEKAMAAKREQRQREKQEAIKREREERLKKELEEEEAKRKAEEERLAKLDAIAEKQRRKEQEIEEKQRRQAAATQPAGPYKPPRDLYKGQESARIDSWKRKDQHDEMDGPSRDEGGWRGRRADDRAPPQRESERDFERGPPRGERGFDRDLERGPPRGERGFERGPPRGEREFERGPPRGDRGFERGPPRGDRDFDRGAPRGDRGFERGPPRGERDFDRGGRDSWRRDGDRQDSQRGPPRDDRRQGWGGPRRDDDMRRSDPPPRDRDGQRGDDDVWRRGDRAPAARREERSDKGQDSGGWNTVRYK